VARDPWAVMDGATRKVDAEDARVAIGALLPTSATNVTARQGLRPGPGSPGLVSQTGTPSINVTVNAFQAFVTATRGAGPYIATEPAALTVPILDVPADPTNQRNDLLIYRQADTYYNDGATLSGVIRVQGNPSGTPVDPDLSAYPDHIKLARVRVTAGAPTVTTSMIDDLRPGWVVALGGNLPVADQAARDALTGTRYDGYPVWRQDRDWVEVFNGAVWQVQGVAVCSSTADRDSAITNPYNGQIATTTDTGTVWIRHSGAWVSYPDVVSANLRQTAAQPMDNAVFEPVEFNAEDFDTHGGHSTVTNPDRYTVPRAGKYELSGGVTFAVNGTGSRGCVWSKNGTQINGSQVMLAANGAILTTLITARTIMVQLAVSDIIRLEGYQNSGGPLNTVVAGSDQSSMSVRYIGP
jgi:hypothetical protein